MKKVLALVLALMMLLGVATAFAEDDFSGTITISVYSTTGNKEAWEAVAAGYETHHPNAPLRRL